MVASSRPATGSATRISSLETTPDSLTPLPDREDKIEKVLQAIALRAKESRARVGQRFPDLEFLDEDGYVVRPLGAAAGPLLLVFFRGFW